MNPAKAIILLASRPETVQIAVERLAPATLGVIFSQDVLLAIAQKCSELGDRGVGFRFRVVDDPMEISDAFSKFELMLSELESAGHSRENVLLDATGGTTPMRLGVALAAISRGVAMIHQRVPQVYANGRWDRDPSREVEVVPMHNPLESTGLLREGQGIDLFNHRDYAAAALVFEDVAKKVSGAERGHYFRGLRLLAHGYAAWDVAEYGQALDGLREARDELKSPFSDTALAERAEELVAGVGEHLPFLGKVRGKLSAHKVVDMLENARRRIADQGRYDDGVARLYRTVEMFHQWRLKERGISTGKVDWEGMDDGAKERFLSAAGLVQLPGELGLRHARLLDRILGGEVLEEDSTLRDLLQKRNRSILAHGFEPIGEAAARGFLEYVDGMVAAREEVRAGARHLTLRGL
jgi:CRISPR-associated protein (TIGR02710 family)